MEDKPNITPVLLVSLITFIIHAVCTLLVYRFVDKITALAFIVGAVLYDIVKIYRYRRANANLNNYADLYINTVFMAMLYALLLVRG